MQKTSAELKLADWRLTEISKHPKRTPNVQNCRSAHRQNDEGGINNNNSCQSNNNNKSIYRQPQNHKLFGKLSREMSRSFLISLLCTACDAEPERRREGVGISICLSCRYFYLSFVCVVCCARALFRNQSRTCLRLKQRCVHTPRGRMPARCRPALGGNRVSRTHRDPAVPPSRCPPGRFSAA